MLCGGSAELVPRGRRRMVAGEDSRVDFGMAEALALGTLALHRGRRPGGCEFGSDLGEQAASPAEARTPAPAAPCSDLWRRSIGGSERALRRSRSSRGCSGWTQTRRSARPPAWA